MEEELFEMILFKGKRMEGVGVESSGDNYCTGL